MSLPAEREVASHLYGSPLVKTPTSDDVDCSRVLPVMSVHPQPGVHTVAQ